MSITKCPCNSGRDFKDCCEPVIKGVIPASSPEVLLRSRYTAHVVMEIPYIVSTVHPEKREEHDEAVIKKWASSSEWLGLEIIKTEKGKTDNEGIVEFIASYREKTKKTDHHEIALFKNIDGVWFYFDSEIPFKQVVNEEPKTGRNEPCPCGSGLKYKKCCG